LKLNIALLNAKNDPIKTIQLGTIEGSNKTKKHAGIPKPIPIALCVIAPIIIKKSAKK
jgi:hypothetical protein